MSGKDEELEAIARILESPDGLAVQLESYLDHFRFGGVSWQEINRLIKRVEVAFQEMGKEIPLELQRKIREYQRGDKSPIKQKDLENFVISR